MKRHGRDAEERYLALVDAVTERYTSRDVARQIVTTLLHHPDLPAVLADRRSEIDQPAGLTVRRMLELAVTDPAGVAGRLADFAEQLQAQAGQSWTAAAEAGARADDLTEAFKRGQAHARCDVLGDQTDLDWLADAARRRGVITQ